MFYTISNRDYQRVIREVSVFAYEIKVDFDRVHVEDIVNLKRCCQEFLNLPMIQAISTNGD